MATSKTVMQSKYVITKWTPAKFDKWCEEINKKRKTKWQWLDKGINWFLPEILMTKKPCNSIWPGAYNWPETTKSDSLQCYLSLMTNSMKKLRNQMILFKETVDQRILQSNLTRSLTDHTQPKVVVSNATFPWWLTACIKI